MNKIIKEGFYTFPPEFYIEFLIVLIIGCIFKINFFIIVAGLFIIGFPMIFGKCINTYFAAPRALFSKKLYISQKISFLIKNQNAKCPSRDLMFQFRKFLTNGTIKEGTSCIVITHSLIKELIEKNSNYVEIEGIPKKLGTKNLNILKRQLKNKHCNEKECSNYPCWKGKDVQQFYLIKFKIIKTRSK